ncbi:hypothetical protein PTI98_010784 [Pleurotus ostreatus]|nr:hypothetical protein PTI98_010784 [Pleurotus ostreatus]
MEQSSSEDDSTTNKDFDVFIIDLYTLEHTTTIHWTPDTEAAVALVRNGYIGASPQAPTLAISLKTLELYHRLHLQKPLFSYEAFTKVLCDLYNAPYRYCWRNALANTYNIYLLLLHTIDKHICEALGRNTPNWHVLNACPPCGYELEGEPELAFRRMLVLNGNNSLKQITHAGQHDIADCLGYQLDPVGNWCPIGVQLVFN